MNPVDWLDVMLDGIKQRTSRPSFVSYIVPDGVVVEWLTGETWRFSAEVVKRADNKKAEDDVK